MPAILSVIMIIALLPSTVLAANTATVKNNGQTLIDGEPVQCGGGTAVWDEENGTLTLNNATINQEITNDYPVRVSNGELKVILIGENTITSTSMKAFYCGSVDFTIQGTERDSLIIEPGSDGLQVDNGKLTIDGCNVDITSTSFGGMMCWGGTLIIPEQTSLTMAEGMTFTNNGNFINSNAFVICADESHVGGTATCTSKVICALCGNEYGDLVSHNLTKTEAQAATCAKEIRNIGTVKPARNISVMPRAKKKSNLPMWYLMQRVITMRTVNVLSVVCLIQISR